MIQQLPAFPAPPLFYVDDVAQDIVAQYAFRNNSLLNEADPSQSATLSGATTATAGRLKTTNTSTSTYSMPVDYFGAGDFTMECNFKVASVSGEALPLMTHWHNGGITNANNRYSIGISADLSVLSTFATSQAAYAYTVRKSEQKIQLNRDHHLVIERWDGIFRVYIDGVLYNTWEQSAPLWATTGNMLNGNYYAASGYGQREVWNIRIANTALQRKSPTSKHKTFQAHQPVGFEKLVKAARFRWAWYAVGRCYVGWRKLYFRRPCWCRYRGCERCLDT